VEISDEIDFADLAPEARGPVVPWKLNDGQGNRLEVDAIRMRLWGLEV